MSMPSRRSREMPYDVQQHFVNSLRDCLGLGPLYGTETEATINHGKKRKQAKARAEADDAQRGVTPSASQVASLTGCPGALAPLQPIPPQPTGSASQAAQASPLGPRAAARLVAAALTPIDAPP